MKVKLTRNSKNCFDIFVFNFVNRIRKLYEANYFWFINLVEPSFYIEKFFVSVRDKLKLRAIIKVNYRPINETLFSLKVIQNI